MFDEQHAAKIAQRDAGLEQEEAKREARNFAAISSNNSCLNCDRCSGEVKEPVKNDVCDDCWDMDLCKQCGEWNLKDATKCVYCEAKIKQ